MCHCSWIWWTDPTASHAFKLSWASVVVTAAAAIAGISLFVVSGSSLILCYGLENCVDLLSSVIVLWRFYCPHGADPTRVVILQKREKRASIAISIVLGVLGIGIIVAAIYDYNRGKEEDENLPTLLGVSFASIVIFGVMAVIKFHYAVQLKSASLQKDGICSLIGTILSGSLFVNTLIIMEDQSAWWLDPTVAMLCGIASLFIGLRSILVSWCVQGIPVYNPRWWIMSEGDGMDEMTGRDLTPADLKLSESGEFGESEMSTVNRSRESPVHGDGSYAGGEKAGSDAEDSDSELI